MAITKLSALKERVHVELRRRQQVDEQTRQELEAEVSQIDSQGELPAGFKEKRLLLSDGNVGESLRQARELRRQIEEWKLESDQRKKRLDPVRKELDKISTHLDPAETTRIKGLIEDESIPPEKMWAEVEKAKLGRAPPPLSPPPNVDQQVKTESFSRSEEDLARLADLYVRSRIIKVDIE